MTCPLVEERYTLSRVPRVSTLARRPPADPDDLEVPACLQRHTVFTERLQQTGLKVIKETAFYYSLVTNTPEPLFQCTRV